MSDSGPAAEGGPAEPGKIPVPSVEPLARSKVRYVGEPIAAVVAETRALADDAAELVVVDYEPLEAYVDPYEARKDGAALASTTPIPTMSASNTKPFMAMSTQRWSFAHSASRSASRPRAVILCRWRPRGIVATPDPITRGVTIWVSNQGPHGYRNEVARTFDLGSESGARHRP